MNLRVVLLKRTAMLHKDCYKAALDLPEKALGPWVTMGHFDTMYSYQLNTDNQNIFSKIRDNNNQISAMNNADQYFHPLYLLTDRDDSQFWSVKSWYMAVTRIHLNSTVNEADVYTTMAEHIHNICNDKGCTCFLYQTVELSDMILVLKSDRLSSILDTALNLWVCPHIGKVYTYCGVDYGHLKNTKRVPDPQDNIDFLSMRFAVRSASLASNFFELVKDMLGKENTYSIAGVDDVILNWQKLPVKKLINFYRQWFVKGFSEEIDVPGAFSDITTRLGAQYAVPTDHASHPDPDALSRVCAELVEINKHVQELAQKRLPGDSNAYWLKCLSELTVSLLRLSRTALLDEFVYLMLPGVKAFLLNLDSLLSASGSDSVKEIDPAKCRFFVESWAHLMEHIMRIEGQLAHQPETRPVLYDIPLAMLEHILVFLKYCSQILQEKDPNKKEINFILIPRLCEQIVATELFSNNSQAPGLVLISIPLHMMYDPQAVQIALCHELSHFVGEAHRNRSYRLECYISAVSALLASVVFKTDNLSFRTCLEQRLKESVPSCSCATIFESMSCITQWITELLDPENVADQYSNFIRDVLISSKLNRTDSDFPIISNFDELGLRSERDFEPLLSDLTILFREVFADICMLRLIKLDAVTYISSFLQDFSEYPDEPYEAYGIRIHAALAAMDMCLPERYLFPDGVVADRLLAAIAHVQRRTENTYNPYGDYRIPAAAVGKLLDYAKKCSADIAELVANHAQMAELYAMYHNVSSPDLDCSILQKHINSYRKEYLTQKRSSSETH